jgi:ribonucleoside-diphosphate reductase beta chain
MYKHTLGSPLPVERVHEMMRSAVALEKEFVCDALPVAMIGMDAKKMAQFIEYMADFWLDFLDLPKLYGVEQPFEFMKMISLPSKSNFFERRSPDYSKGVADTSGNGAFTLVEDL